MLQPINGVGLKRFKTQRNIMEGTWSIWDEERRRKHVRILVREAYKTQYDGETFIVVYDE